MLEEQNAESQAKNALLNPALMVYSPLKTLGRPRRERMTLTEAMQMLARQMGAEEASEETIDAYTRDVRHFAAFLNSIKARDAVPHFTRENVEKWCIEQTEKGISPKTRNRRLAALRRLAQFLLLIGKIHTDPTALIRRAKVPKRIVQYLPAEVAARLTRAAKPTTVHFFNGHKHERMVVYRKRNEAILRVFVQGGLRLREVQSLSLRSVREDGLVVYGKGRKERMVTLSPQAMETIRAWLEERRGTGGPEDALFTNYAGGRLSANQISRIVAAAAKSLGLIGVHPHLLRHTMATLLYQRSGDLKAVKDRLGHEKLSTTEGYIHAAQLVQDEAAKLLADL